jgi:hypothetical protein
MPTNKKLGKGLSSLLGKKDDLHRTVNEKNESGISSY